MNEDSFPYNVNSFSRLIEKMNFSKNCFRQRINEASYATKFPHEIGLKLTNRCDLRCKHCFQWNDTGYHRSLDKCEKSKDGDLDIEIVKKIFSETLEIKSHIYLWGGEPLIYSNWDELIILLKNDRRHTVICTNGMTIINRIESLIEISENLTMLVSIEGLERHHDLLRGKTSFKNVMENLTFLLELKANGIYKGLVSVACVLNNELIPDLFQCCEFYNNLNIDTLFINFPWYIPEGEVAEMDELFDLKFSWMGWMESRKHTWDSFSWHIDESLIESLEIQIKQIKLKKWNIRIRFQPNVQIEEIAGYIKGSSKPVQKKSMCLGISNRMDVMPNGDVTPCKKFTEFCVGNLTVGTLSEIWHGEDFHRFRKLHDNQLMPICAQCEILYSNGW